MLAFPAPAPIGVRRLARGSAMLMHSKGAAGAVVYRRAKEIGLGHDLPTDWFTQDVHP